VNLADLPPAISIEELWRLRILPLGRTALFDAARRGELPGAIRIGRRWIVGTMALLRALGIEQNEA